MTSTTVFQAQQHLRGMNGLLAKFMPVAQRHALLEALGGEEAEGIAQVVMDTVERIRQTPMTYQTEGQDEKELCLHYFRGGVDAWIVERDVGDSGDPDAPGAGEGAQLQAYGKITLFGIGWEEADWGYISIVDLIANGVELDLYWTPKSTGEM